MQLFLAQHSQEFEEIYRLRYRAYRSIQAIDENSLQQFSDVFDKQDNCFIFGLKSGGGSIMASLRVLVSSHGHKGRDELTATKAFKDVIENEFSSHQILVESNRFVFDPDLGNTVKKGFEQQLMLFKGLCIISLLFSADEYIGATRKHHIAFYKRVLLMSPLSEERQYPGLNINMRLLSGSFKENYLKVCERWGDKIKVTDAELVEYQQMIFGNIKSTI